MSLGEDGLMIEPFHIRVGDEAVEDLTRRVSATRLGEPPAGEPWTPDLVAIRDFVRDVE